jgi:hypothetical protein
LILAHPAVFCRTRIAKSVAASVFHEMDHPLRITRLEQRVAAVQAFAHQPCSADFPAFVRSCGRAAGRLARRLLSTTWRTPQQPSITARCVLRNHTSGPRSAGSRRLGGECAHDCVRASCSTVPPSLALASAKSCAQTKAWMACSNAFGPSTKHVKSGPPAARPKPSSPHCEPCRCAPERTGCPTRMDLGPHDLHAIVLVDGQRRKAVSATKCCVVRSNVVPSVR